MPENSLSLYEIESGLQTIIEARAAAEDDGAPPDELAAIDQALQEYLAREVRKVDGTAKAILAFEAAADAADEEAARLAYRAQRHRETAQRIKSHALEVMLSQTAPCPDCKGIGANHNNSAAIPCERCNASGRVPSPITKLETPTHFLRIQNNGGVEPLETDVEKLSEDFKIYTVTMTGDNHHWLGEIFRDSLADCDKQVMRLLAAAPATANANKIRKALKRGEVVPGARLGERGKHLRVG